MPQLQKFTDAVIRNGKSVVYNMEDKFYPGLIHASIFSPDGPTFERELIIDPYMIYGDTLRIIVPNGPDIRKGTFIAISQMDFIEKAINGTLDGEDTRAIMEKLPRALLDFREKYTLIDRVDLSGLMKSFLRTVPDDKKSKTVCMPFKLWQAFIVNLSNVLRDKNVPVCRFRLESYSAPNKFSLICDEKVNINYVSPIWYEETHRMALADKLFVEYDSDKFKDKYTYGKITPFK